MTVAQFSSGGVAIRYVLPVLWTTSFAQTWPHGGMSIQRVMSSLRRAQANAPAASYWLRRVGQGVPGTRDGACNALLPCFRIREWKGRSFDVKHTKQFGLT